MKSTATVSGKVVSVTGGSDYTVACSTEEVAKRVAYYTNTYQKPVKPTGSKPSHIDGWQLDEDREKRVVFRWVDKVITDVGLCNSFVEANEFYTGKNTGPIPQDKEIMKEEPAKDGVRTIGKAVETRWQGKVRSFQCKDEATAQLVANACEELEVRPGVESGYYDDSWMSAALRHEKLEYAMTPILVLRWDDALVVQNAAVVHGDLERRGIRKRWDAEAKAATQKAGTPEPAAEKVATAAEEAPIYIPGVRPAILEEANKSRLVYRQTGVIPEPSTALLSGYQPYCTCGLCAHIRDYQKQEADRANIDRATEALIKTAATIQDQKKSGEPGLLDLTVNANVTQTANTKSEATNKESIMANDPKPVRVPSQLELEAQAAALRTAMRQLTKLIHEPLAAALAAQLTPAGGDPAAMKAKVGEFLKSEIGSALVASLLSLGIGSIPANMIPGLTPERQASASKELRIGAMTAAGDTLLDLVMEPLRNVLVGLAAGPAAEALTGVRAADVGLDDATQETVEETAQQAAGVKKVNF